MTLKGVPKAFDLAKGVCASRFDFDKTLKGVPKFKGFLAVEEENVTFLDGFEGVFKVNILSLVAEDWISSFFARRGILDFGSWTFKRNVSDFENIFSEACRVFRVEWSSESFNVT